MSTGSNAGHEVTEIYRRLGALRNEFRNKLSPAGYSIGTNDVRFASAAEILDYVGSVLACVGNAPSEFDSAWPAIDLSFLQIRDELVLPPNAYPATKFHETTFDQGAQFIDCSFLGPVDFSQTHLSENARIGFSHVKFRDFVKFTRSGPLFLTFDNSTEFGGFAYFDRAQPQFLELNEVHFLEGLDFTAAEIGVIRLHDVRFPDVTNFDRCTFARSVDFGLKQRVKFGVRLTSFRNATFKEEAKFDGATFVALADFHGARFDGPAFFNGATFSDEANFNNASFQDSTYFTRCHFHTPPRLHEAKLHSDTSFTGATFESFATESDWRAYRRLRHLMHQAQANLEEGQFFAYEQRSLAALDLERSRVSITGNLSRLYDWISHYGQSISRTLCWLFSTLAVFVLTFFIASQFVVVASVNASANNWTKGIAPWLGLALQNAITPLGSLAMNNPYVPTTWWAAGLCVIQSVVTLAIYALLLLAVGRRFRKVSD